MSLYLLIAYIMMIFLVGAAIVPIILLCGYIYSKDTHKEPMGLLAKIFILGFVSAYPVVEVELLLGNFFSTDKGGLIVIFIGTFISVALVEEGFKWLITKFFGYNNEEFDEVFDVIVYSVFASLGFACIENILYVLQYQNPISRALISIPGHTCFGVLMGYYFAQAKVASMNNNQELCNKNMLKSIFVPTFFHAVFDALIFTFVEKEYYFYLSLFFIFDICMVIYCFLIVNKVSKVQQNLTSKIKSGVISNNGRGQIVYNEAVPKTVNYCPICGSPVRGGHFCNNCGFNLDYNREGSN